MTPEAITDFLTGYIRSLSEETRNESKGPRHGFDHIIYEIAFAESLRPVRLSFLRQGEGELSSPKKEPEHGVDAAFITRDGKTLTVFVLKDEVLSYRNWTEERFDYDLRRARNEDLTTPELRSVTEVWSCSRTTRMRQKKAWSRSTSSSRPAARRSVTTHR